MLTTFDQTRKSTAINSCTRRARIIFTAWCTSGPNKVERLLEDQNVLLTWRKRSLEPPFQMFWETERGAVGAMNDFVDTKCRSQINQSLKQNYFGFGFYVRKSDFHDVSIFHADGDVIPTEVTRIFPKGSFPSVPIWFSWLQIASEIELASLWGIIHKCHHACIQLFTSTYIYLSIFPI